MLRYGHRYFFIGTFFLVSVAKAQIGLPSIKTFPSTEYREGNAEISAQNFSIIEGNDSRIYLANYSGILCYDGRRWSVVKNTEGNTFYRFAKDSTGKIYVGGNSDFGYLGVDKSGSPAYISLKMKLPESDRDFQLVRSVIPTKKGVYFFSENEVIRFHGTHLLTWHLQENINLAFAAGGDIYLEKTNGGICRFSDGILEEISNSAGKSNPLKFAWWDKGIHSLFQDGSYSQAKTDGQKVGVNGFVLTGLQLYDGVIVAGTSNQGIYFLKGDGKYHLDHSNGLPDESAISLYQDHENGLWIALNNGVCRIQYPAGITYFDYSLGIDGIVNTAREYDGRIYTGTQSGLYELAGNRFVKTPGINSEVWNLVPFNDRLLAAAIPDGIIEISKTGINKTGIRMNIQSLVPSKRFPGIIYAGTLDGMGAVIYKNGRYTWLGRFTGIDHEVRFIAEQSDGRIWAGYDQFSRIDLSNGFHLDAAVEKMAPENGFNSDGSEFYEVYKLGAQVVFGTSSGAKVFDEASQKLQPYAVISKALNSGGTKDAYTITQDSHGTYWLTSGNRACRIFKNAMGNYELDTLSLLQIPKTDIWSIYPDDNGVVWFCTTDGLYRYDANFKGAPLPKTFNTAFSRISATGDTVLTYGAGKLSSPTLSYNLNNLVFEYSGLTYASDKIYFRYILEGQDKVWSSWSSQYRKEYTGLFEGSYTFKAQAMDMYGRLGTIAEYHFTILPPWYRTWWAYLLYVLAAVGAIRGGYILYSKRLKRQNEHLERLVASRTEEIELERERTDELLKNILPDVVADELRVKGVSRARHFERVSVLFADFVGFTPVAEKMAPEDLVELVDRYFRAFDGIIDLYGLEKIKTIGDCYMAAAGLPDPLRGKPEDVVRAAQEIVQYVAGVRLERNLENAPSFDIRVGIHTGPVVAGVVGARKFAYDIWGDTVNTAARMEQSGEPGRINISGDTYQFVKDNFFCVYRGKVQAKNKGEIDMYFVERERPKVRRRSNA